MERAHVRAIAQMIACDIHPLNNTSPLRYLKHQLKHSQDEIDEWYRHWVIEGFAAVEAMIKPGPYICGARVTLADLCLVPQVYNARRFKVPIEEKFPEDRRSRCRMPQTAGLRQGSSRKPAGRGVTQRPAAC